MMTLAELQAAEINPDVAREAYEQSSKRLEDALTTKAGHEQKAFALLGGFIAVSLALFGAGSVFLSGEEQGDMVALPFLVAGVIQVVGACFFLWALLDDIYGALGSHPEMWLNRGTIDGGDAVLPAMLAYIAHHHRDRINRSVQANNSKAIKIRIGTVLGMVSLLVLGIWLVRLS
jgi:hypothetical protein